MLGDADGAGRVVEGVQAAVVQEEHAVGDVADAGELVGRDDERLGAVGLSNDEHPVRVAAREESVVDEKESVRVRQSVVQLRRVDEVWAEGELDRSRVQAAETG